MTIGWWWRPVAVAAVVLGLFAAGVSPASADYRVDCNPTGDSRQIVVLVHGFMSGPSTWDHSTDILTGGGTDTCIVRFDFTASNNEWVTNPNIGPALAAFITKWQGVSTIGGGSGKVVLVAHSMGGLAARCAVDPTCSGHDGVADRVAELITFGTPNTGSGLRGSDATPVFNLLANLLSAGCHTAPGAANLVVEGIGLCGLIRDFGTSDATKALSPDSRELKLLPRMPTGKNGSQDIPVYALAGQINVTTSMFGHTIASLDSVGDLVVGVRSALDEVEEVGNLGGQLTIDCGTVDIAVASGPAWSTLFCWHGSEVSYDQFLNRARHQIEAINSQHILSDGVVAGVVTAIAPDSIRFRVVDFYASPSGLDSLASAEGRDELWRQAVNRTGRTIGEACTQDGQDPTADWCRTTYIRDAREPAVTAPLSADARLMLFTGSSLLPEPVSADAASSIISLAAPRLCAIEIQNGKVVHAEQIYQP